jgi:O-antigen ligase
MAGLGFLFMALAGLALFPGLAHPLAQAWSLALLAMAAACTLARPFKPQLLAASWLLLGLPLLLALPALGWAAWSSLSPLVWAMIAFYLGQWLAAESLLGALMLAAVPLLLLQAGLCLQQSWQWLPAMARNLADPQAAAIAGRGRVFGSFVDPNLLASACILFLPGLWVLVLKGKSAWQRLAALLGVAAAGTCLWLAKPLAGLAGLALGLAYLSWSMRKEALGKISAGALLLALLGLLAVLLQRGAEGAGFWQGHLPIWQAAWQAFLQRPWCGWGSGIWAQEAFWQASRQVPGAYGLYAHDSLLSLLLAQGLWGLLGWGVWGGLLVARLLKGAARRPVLWHAALAGLLGVLLQSLSDIPLEFMEIWVPAVILLGALLGPAHPGLADEGSARPSPWAPVGPWILSGLMLAALFFRGGLMPWQPLLAWGLLATILISPASRLSLGAEPLERLGLLGLAWLLMGGLLGIHAAASLESLGVLAGAFLLWAVLRRGAAPMARAVLKSAAWLGLGALFLALVWSWILPSQDLAWAEGFRLVGVRAIFPNADLLGGYLAITLPLFLLPTGHGRGWAWLAAGLAAGLACLGLALCQSRGALLALLVAAGVYALRTPGRQRWLLPGLAGLALALALGWAVAGGALTAKIPGLNPVAGASQDPLRNARLMFWKSGLGLAAKQAPLGSGLATFGQAIEQGILPRALASDNPIARLGMRLEHAHSEPLEWLVETGAPGLLVLLGLLALALARWRRAQAEPALEAALAALACQSLYDFDLHCLPLLLLGIMLAAALLPAAPPQGIPAQPAPAKAHLMAAGLLLLLGVALAAALSRLGTAASLSEHARRRSARVALQGLDAQAWSEKAQLEEQMAVAEGREDRFPRALACHLRAVMAAPDWAPGHFALAQFLERCGSQGSPALCGQVLGPLLPDWASTGDGTANQRILQLALQEELTGLRWQPGNVFEHRRASQIWQKLGFKSQGIEELERAVELEPNYLAAWEDLDSLEAGSVGENGMPRFQVNRIKHAGFHALSLYEIALIKTSK